MRWEVKGCLNDALLYKSSHFIFFCNKNNVSTESGRAGLLQSVPHSYILDYFIQDNVACMHHTSEVLLIHTGKISLEQHLQSTNIMQLVLTTKPNADRETTTESWLYHFHIHH